MAIHNPPGWLQNAGATHSAAQLRSYFGGALLGDRTSLKPTGGVAYTMGSLLAVTEDSPASMNVQVGSGICYIPGTENATQGVYAAMNDGTVLVPIATAHATLARIDLIIVRVRDSQYSGVDNNVAIEAVTGTPAGSPVAPATPANSLVLARVSVVAAATAISNNNITDYRKYNDHQITIRKTTDETVNNTATLQDDDHLILPTTGINQKWALDGFIQCSSSTTADIKFTFTIPSGAECRFNVHGPASSATGGEGSGSFTLLFAPSGYLIGGIGTGTALVARISGYISIVGTPGYTRLQWAQGVAEVSNTIVYVNSWLSITRIPV